MSGEGTGYLTAPESWHLLLRVMVSAGQNLSPAMREERRQESEMVVVTGVAGALNFSCFSIFVLKNAFLFPFPHLPQVFRL